MGPGPPDKVKSAAGGVSCRALSPVELSWWRARDLVPPPPALTIHNERLELQVGEMERGRERVVVGGSFYISPLCLSCAVFWG